MSDISPRQCHVCGDWSSDWIIDRDTLLNARHTRPICKPCLAKREAPQAKAFPDTLPFQRHSESSRDGARKAWPKAQSQAVQVLTILAQNPAGLIEEQIRFDTDMERNECTRAINTLHGDKAGLKWAEIAPERRAAKSGVMVQVYRITKAGRDALAHYGRKAA